MWIIYNLEMPFFERYKINKGPWPWHKNKDEWKKLFKKSMILTLFNNFVVFPLAILGGVLI